MTDLIAPLKFPLTPAQRAELAEWSKAIARDIERAGIMWRAQAGLMSRLRNGGVRVEAPSAPPTVTPPPARDTLAEVDDDELLRRAVQGLCARDRSQAPCWALVMDTLGLTSGAAVMLCRRLNIDPNKRTGH